MRKQRILAALLAFVLVLSMVPAVQLSASANVAEDADVIRLPITVRDVNQDRVLFEGRYNTTTSFDHDPGLGNQDKYYVGHQLVNGVPQYNDEAIRNVAALVVNRNSDNTYLNSALNAARDNHQSTWNRTTSSQYDEDVTYLEDAPTAYSAAKWILSHLFEDGQYYADHTTGQNEFNARYNYTKTYPGYESLVLQKGTYKNGDDCYFYTSNYPLGSNENNLQDTMFNYTNGVPTGNDEIYNVANGTDSQHGGWFPLDGLVFAQEGTPYNSPKNTHNYHTTTAGSGQFVYHKDDNLFFAFTGDDDFFFYVNDQLVIDDGGVHGQEESWVYLEESVAATQGQNNRIRVTGVDSGVTWAEYLGLEEGGIYNFNFFQMERNIEDSNFSIYTNINVVDSSAVPAKKAYQNGQELIYGSFVPQNSEVTYGFEMTNNGNTKVNSNITASAITNLTFEDDLLGVILTPDNLVISTDVSQNTYADLEYAIYKTEDGAPSTYTKLDNATGEATLKSLLAEGVAPGYTFSIRGFKYNVGMPSTGETTKTIVNTVTTTAQGKANNSGATKTLHGTASMRIRTWDIQNKTFVMDYAKTMTLTNAEVFGDELTELSGDGITVIENISDSETVQTVASLSNTVDVSLNRENGDFGTMAMEKTTITSGTKTYDGYDLTYTPTEILKDIDSFILRVTLDTTTTITTTTGNGTTEDVSTGSNTLNKNVTIVPANNVYYEDNFVKYTNATTEEGDASVQIVYNGNNTASSGNVENAESQETGTGKGVHGWEDSLANDTLYSDGSATKMTTGATATFTFTGTGVDIYSYTDMTTGTVTAKLVGANGNEETKYLMVDNLAVSGDYYQIPTLFWNDLPYGTYTVTLVVNNAKAYEGVDADGNIVYSETATRNTYYLDGIRVYNPIQNLESTEVVKDAYGTEELNAVFKGVRELMAEDTDVDGDSGTVFIDLNGTVGKQAEYDATEYGTYGPKNEVYLAPGQSITFKVDSNSGNYYQIGLKAPEGTTSAAFSNTAETNSSTEIAHSTDLYYKVTPVNGMITVKNTGDTNILSVTKVKMTGTDTTSGVMLLNLTAEEATTEVATFSMRSTVVYAAEPEKEEEVLPEEPVVPEEPEVPDIDVDIENPTEPEEDPTQGSNSNEALKNLITDLFKKIFGWFGR